MCCDSLISRPAQLGNSEKSPTEYLKLLASTLAHQCSLESLSWLSREIVSKRTYLARGRASGRSRLSAEPKHTTRRPFPSATSARCSNSNPTELKWRLLKIEKRRQWTTDDDFRIREVSKCLHWSVIIHDAAFDVSMLWHTSASPDVNRATDRQQLQSWPCLYVTSAGRCASSSWACLGMQLTSVSPSQRNAMFHSDALASLGHWWLQQLDCMLYSFPCSSSSSRISTLPRRPKQHLRQVGRSSEKPLCRSLALNTAT